MITKIYDALRTNFEAQRAYKKTISSLGRLNGRQLHDIGIARCDIPRLAAEAADKARQAQNEVPA